MLAGTAAPSRSLGLKVLEISESAGAGFTGSMLADFGAKVYIAEQPPDGSRQRAAGPPEAGADWWEVVARNKRSLAIDPTHDDAPAVMTRLLSHVDVVVTDIGRPNWAADPWLRLLDGISTPPLVVDVFPPGADRPDLWPWSVAPELAGAATGMLALTGWASGPPTQPEAPLAEYLAGTLAAAGAMAELRRAHVTGTPPVHLPVALHEAVQRSIEWQVPVATVAGRAEMRGGNNFPLNAGVSNMHQTKDGKHVAISAATQAVASRLLTMVGGEALDHDPRFASPAARADNMPALYRIIDEWVGTRTAAEVDAIAKASDVVIGPIYAIDNILSDPQIAARQNIVRSARGVPMPAVLPSISTMTSVAPAAAPRLGEHTGEMLTLAGYGMAEIDQMKGSGLIWA